MTARMVLQPFNPGDDPNPASQVYYDLINDTIQPDTRTTMEVTVNQIANWIPTDDGNEARNFLDMCIVSRSQRPNSLRPSVAE